MTLRILIGLSVLLCTTSSDAQTILHLLGFDHERLTFRYGGREMRLTDVAGSVAREFLA